MDLTAYDIYLFQSSGKILFAGCSDSDYCKNHSDEHVLHSALITVLNSFIEKDSTNNFNNLLHNQIQFNFQTLNDITVMTVHPIESPREEIQDQLRLVLKRFAEKYSNKLNSLYQGEIFEEFRPIIVEIGVVKSQLSKL